MATFPCRGLPAEDSVTLTLRVFPCARDLQAEPALRVSDIAKSFAEIPVRARWAVNDAAWETTFNVPVGHYIVSSGSPHCSGETEQWIAIPGDLRHLAITINKTKVATVDEDMYAGAVYGYLPIGVTSVEVMQANSVIGEQTRRTATVDGNTYQIGHLPQGSYVIRLAFGNVVASRQVSIPKDVYGPEVRADFTTADAASIVQQQAAGSGFVPLPDKQFPGETFRLGAATIGGWTTEPLTPPSDYFTGEQRISKPMAGALATTQHFLASSPLIPPTFRTFASWTIRLGGGGPVLVVRLDATDIEAWQKKIPKQVGFCNAYTGAHYVQLAIEDGTWKIAETRICP